jgi:hypothetical protein
LLLLLVVVLSHRYSVSEGEASDGDLEGSCGEELEEGGLDEHLTEEGLLAA